MRQQSNTEYEDRSDIKRRRARLLDDLRAAARAVVRARGFSAAAVCVLALGLAASSTIYAVMDATLLRPLPFPRPDRLVTLRELSPEGSPTLATPQTFIDWAARNHTFASMAAIVGSDMTLTGVTTSAERLTGQAVSSGFFEVLGVSPLAGRTLRQEDAAPGVNVVVISSRLWRERFGADSTLVGRSIVLDGQPRTVVGVVDAGIPVLAPNDCWVPLRASPPGPAARRSHYLRVVGRLKPELSLMAARADMAAVANSIAAESPETNRNWGVTVEPLRDAVIGRDLRLITMVLAGVVMFVLLIASANTANLLLSRAIARQHEFAIRRALGATPGRLARMLLAESVLLAALGGTVGLAASWIAIRGAASLLPAGTLPDAVSLAFDARLGVVTFLLALMTGVLVGLLPAWRAATGAAPASLMAGTRVTGASFGLFRKALVAGEIAAAVVLLTGAGLLLRSLGALTAVEPGFQASRVLTMYVSPPIAKYAGGDRLRTFYRDVENELAGLPGVRAAAIGGNVPLDGSFMSQNVEVVGVPATGSALPQAQYQIVSARYFEALGIPMLKGRAFSRDDRQDAEPVCIVNEAFVRKYLGGVDPLTASVIVPAVSLRGPERVTRRIVGVARQVKEQRAETQDAVELYVPVEQNPWFTASIVVATENSPAAALRSIQSAVSRVDPDLPVTRVRTMDEIAESSLAQPRLRTGLLGSFGVIALVLAAVGLFTVLAFDVQQRRRELGIRSALGARPAQLVAQVLRAAGVVVMCGLAAGIAAAIALTRLLRTFLFAVGPLDGPTFAGAAVTLALTALLACLVPAIRAARVDPVRVLRS